MHAPTMPSVEKLKDAFETFDWDKVEPLLSLLGGEDAQQESIAEALRRANGLVLRRPTNAQKRRDAMITQLQQYLSAKEESGEVPPAVASVLTTLEVAETGYRELLNALALTKSSSLTGTVHIAAAIRFAETQFDRMVKDFRSQAHERGGITMQTKLVEADGSQVDMDAALEALVNFVSITLQMEAHGHEWFSEDDSIILPSLPEVGADDVAQAGVTQRLAMAWMRWETTEGRARLFGRTLRFLKPHEMPDRMAQNAKHAVIEEGECAPDLLHYVAKERTLDKMNHALVEIGLAKDLYSEDPWDPNTVHFLPPHEWLSREECHGIYGLGRFLSCDILSDQDRPGGLRLLEWVRGYASLLLLARDGKPGDFVRTRSGWQHFFAGFGLASSVSDIFISRLTFGRKSRDLFDHPFLKLEDGQYKLVAMAIRSLSIPITVLSTLSQMEVSLDKKGRRFESALHQTFKNAGISSYAFKETRANEIYEYDAIVPWGEFLFFIECKSRLLPFGNPTRMRNFEEEVRADSTQIHRLLQALETYPEILAKNIPIDVSLKIRIPIVINCFPYAVPGKHNGVFYYDYSALERFFDSGEIKIRSKEAGKPIEDHPSGIRLWSGDKPTPKDLIAQMCNPQQFDAVFESIKLDPCGFPLAPDIWVFDKNFVRVDNGELERRFSELTADK